MEGSYIQEKKEVVLTNNTWVIDIKDLNNKEIISQVILDGNKDNGSSLRTRFSGTTEIATLDQCKIATAIQCILYNTQLKDKNINETIKEIGIKNMNGFRVSLFTKNYSNFSTVIINGNNISFRNGKEHGVKSKNYYMNSNFFMTIKAILTEIHEIIKE